MYVERRSAQQKQRSGNKCVEIHCFSHANRFRGSKKLGNLTPLLFTSAAAVFYMQNLTIIKPDRKHLDCSSSRCVLVLKLSDLSSCCCILSLLCVHGGSKAKVRLRRSEASGTLVMAWPFHTAFGRLVPREPQEPQRVVGASKSCLIAARDFSLTSRDCHIECWLSENWHEGSPKQEAEVASVRLLGE